MTVKDIDLLIRILETFGGPLWAGEEGNAPELIMDIIDILDKQGYELQLIKKKKQEV